MTLSVLHGARIPYAAVATVARLAADTAHHSGTKKLIFLVYYFPQIW